MRDLYMANYVRGGTGFMTDLGVHVSPCFI
jgi:hypothetical protein